MGYLLKAIIGAALFLLRGSPPWSRERPEDGELGGTIVGITFLVMGAPALLLALWGFVTGLGDRDERPAAAATLSEGSGRLQALREKGSLTEKEFQREEAKVLAEM